MERKKWFFTSTFCLIFCILGYAQPHIKGHLQIDMESGTFNCSFNLSGIPEIGNYRILLNKGMNVKYFKDKVGNLLDYDGHFDGKTRGEAIEYVFINPKNDTIALPNEFSIEYRGAFPIYQEEFNVFDYKGIIAFNGKTLRASEQTKWYPVLYDALNDKYFNNYTYELTVEINRGNSFFLNGAAPHKGKEAKLISKKAVPLLLFAGDFGFIKNDNGDYIINADVDKKNIVPIFENIKTIKKILSDNIGIEFTDKIYLINHEAINKRKKGSSWGFNTYPSFLFTGLNFNMLVDEKGKFSNENYKYFGHEFAHNYFGDNVMSGSLRWFWSESFAEYLSYQVTADICGKDIERKILLKEINGLNTFNFIPLPKIKTANEIGEKYRYVMGPLILKCFEVSFGKEKINGTIKRMLSYSEKETLTIDHLKKAALESGIDEKEFEKFMNTYISSENFKENVIKLILDSKN